MEKHDVLLKFFEATDKVKNGHGQSHYDKKIKLDLRQKYKIPPSGCNMLRALLENGSLNQRSIAKLMNISSQAVSEAIKKLEFNELIIKENGTHNNEKIITLTEIGIIFAKELDKGLKGHSRKVFENFSDEECELLSMLLDKIINSQ